MSYKCGGSMLQKEVMRAESPKHADTRQPAIASRFQVDIAITHIYRMFLSDTQLA